MKAFPAHIRHSEQEKVIQTVSEHCRNTARYAAETLEPAGLYHTGYLAGLLHDMGKAKEEFRQYIEKASEGGDVRRGSVNHTFCAVIYLMERYHTKGAPAALLTAEVISYAAGAHHGLFDCVNLSQESGFEYRLLKDREEICYQEAAGNFLASCADKTEIDREFALACGEIADMLKRMRAKLQRSNQHFLLGLLTRLVLSAVIDGDRRDTAAFMSGREPVGTGGAPVTLWRDLLCVVEQKTAGLDRSGGINQIRHQFSEACGEFANRPGGIYRLNLPTGAGKTLAGLRYALAHAANHGKRRILFVIPLLSILEQNSAVIRHCIGREDVVTEHHSNVVKTFETPEALDRYELLCESWETPVLITTLVQLLNSMFDGRTTSIRRFHALIDSVIVIDEVQTVPMKMLHLFNAAVNFLAHCCGASVILASATQPRLDLAGEALCYTPPGDIVPYDPAAFGVFKRTRMVDKTSPYGMSIEEAGDFCAALAQSAQSLLVICNTKASARGLFQELRGRGLSGVVHLSASMCARHRVDTLAQLRASLESGEKCICVSTQLVEAGVDVSFETVVRMEAGIDSLVQAAGRCNRSGEFGRICDAYICNLRPGCENLSMLHEIEIAQRCTRSLLWEYKKQPEKFQGDLLSRESVSAYYEKLLQDADIRKQAGYPCRLGGRTENLFNLLADNADNLERVRFRGRYYLNQAFQTAGAAFQVFDEETTDIIVPYLEEGRQLAADLLSQRAAADMAYTAALLQSAKLYTVSIFGYERQKLEEMGMLYSDSENRFLILNGMCYSEATGLTFDLDYMF